MLRFIFTMFFLLPLQSHSWVWFQETIGWGIWLLCLYIYTAKKNTYAETYSISKNTQRPLGGRIYNMASILSCLLFGSLPWSMSTFKAKRERVEIKMCLKLNKAGTEWEHKGCKCLSTSITQDRQYRLSWYCLNTTNCINSSICLDWFESHMSKCSKLYYFGISGPLNRSVLRGPVSTFCGQKGN